MVFPTRVGMDQWISTTQGTETQYSPHAWGWTINKLGEYRDKWVFPTRVGMDLS